MSNSNNNIIYALRKSKVINALKLGKRIDERTFDEYRKAEIQYDISQSANGSARVRLGKTDVIVGIKIDEGKPYPDNPDQGSITVNTELLPLASTDFELGPPSAKSIELARVVDRGIRESKCVNFSELCITPGEKILNIYLDGYVVNQDGNLFDAMSLAALAALTQTKLPKIEDNAIVKDAFAGKLKLSKKPLLSTFAKIDDFVVLDPNYVEEQVMTATFSIATTEDALISACQKAGPGSFKENELYQIAETAIKKSKELRKLL